MALITESLDAPTVRAMEVAFHRFGYIIVDSPARTPARCGLPSGCPTVADRTLAVVLDADRDAEKHWQIPTCSAHIPRAAEAILYAFGAGPEGSAITFPLFNT